MRRIISGGITHMSRSPKDKYIYALYKGGGKPYGRDSGGNTSKKRVANEIFTVDDDTQRKQKAYA